MIEFYKSARNTSIGAHSSRAGVGETVIRTLRIVAIIGGFPEHSPRPLGPAVRSLS